MSPYTEGLYNRFIACLQENNIKYTPTPKDGVVQVDFVTPDDEVFSELVEIVGVDPQPLGYGGKHRVNFL